MTKTPIIRVEGQELTIPNEKADELPITLSYTQAKALAKQLRPPMTEKQREHVQKMVEANKLKWAEKKKAKEEEERQKAEALKQTTTKILVKPKRIYPSKTPKNTPDEHEEVEYIEEIVKVPKKKIIKKIIQQEEEDDEEDDDDELIQKTKKIEKATKLVDTVNKLDQKIEQMKNSTNRYDSLLSKFKF